MAGTPLGLGLSGTDTNGALGLVPINPIFFHIEVYSNSICVRSLRLYSPLIVVLTDSKNVTRKSVRSYKVLKLCRQNRSFVKRMLLVLCHNHTGYYHIAKTRLSLSYLVNKYKYTYLPGARYPNTDVKCRNKVYISILPYLSNRSRGINIFGPHCIDPEYCRWLGYGPGSSTMCPMRTDLRALAERKKNIATYRLLTSELYFAFQFLLYRSKILCLPKFLKVTTFLNC